MAEMKSKEGIKYGWMVMFKLYWIAEVKNNQSMIPVKQPQNCEVK